MIAPQRVASSANIADVFTKAVSGPLFSRLTSQFMFRHNAAIPATVHALMFRADDDSSEDVDELEPSAHVKDLFHSNWPYASTVAKELGADKFDIIETDQTFRTGRRKYNISFYKVVGGDKLFISRHLAMRLVSSTNNAYMVCLRSPILSSEAQVEVPVPSSSSAILPCLATSS